MGRSYQTQILFTATPAELERAVGEAVRLLQSGAVVALPTETVYGLAGDALNAQAAARIFEAKERPAFDPLICHLPELGWVERMAQVPAGSRALVAELARRFWPGPLTMVLPRRAIVPDLVTSGLETVALRISAHPVFATIVQRLGRPLAAPSANRFGRISPTTAEHVRAELDGRIPLIVDGGATVHGLESTIVAVEGDGLRILRSGPVSREQLAELAPLREHTAPAHPEAPGQLESHYAPRTPMRLCATAEESGGISVVLGSSSAPAAAHGRIGFLAWQTVPPGNFAAVEVLSPRGDLREAAATLFAKMRRLDEAGLDLILAQTVPERGLGAAIMDRLSKASAIRTLVHE